MKFRFKVSSVEFNLYERISLLYIENVILFSLCEVGNKLELIEQCTTSQIRKITKFLISSLRMFLLLQQICGDKTITLLKSPRNFIFKSVSLTNVSAHSQKILPDILSRSSAYPAQRE